MFRFHGIGLCRAANRQHFTLNPKHNFTSLGKESFTLFGKHFFHWGKQIHINTQTFQFEFHIFKILKVDRDVVNGFQNYDADTVARYEGMYGKKHAYVPAPADDCYLLLDQISYVQSQQAKATTPIADPTFPHFEPGLDKRRTAARMLMRHWERKWEKQ